MASAPEAPASLPREVYALGPNHDKAATDKVSALLSEQEKKELRELCGRTMYHSLQVLWVEAGMGRGWLQHCGTRAGTGLGGRGLDADRGSCG